MPGTKPLPLHPAPTGAGGKGAWSFPAQALFFPGPTPLRHGSGGLFRALPPSPASGFAAPVPSDPPIPRAVLRPMSRFSFRDKLAASARLSCPFPPFPPAAAPLVSGACKRLPAARPLVQGPAPSALVLNPGEAASLSAGTNA